MNELGSLFVHWFMCRDAGRTLFFGAVLLATLLGSGCQTNTPRSSRIVNEPAPLSETLRAGFGVVGMVPAELTDEFSFHTPPGGEEAAAKAAHTTFTKMERSTRLEHHHDDESFHFQPATTGFADPVDELGARLAYEGGRILFSALVSGAAGLFAGHQAEAVRAHLEQGRAAIGRALSENPLEPGIHQQLLGIAAENAVQKLVPIPKSALVGRKPGDARARDYSSLAGMGIDSVLIIHVYDQHFSAGDGNDPPLSYVTGVDVFVIRAVDGKLLHAGYLTYQSEKKRPFADWVAQDAKYFRRETRRAQADFAKIIAAQLFGWD